MADGQIDPNSRIKKQWYVDGDKLLFSQNNDKLDVAAHKKAVQRLIDIAHH